MIDWRSTFQEYFLEEKRSIVFDSGVYIWSNSQKRRLATSIIQTLQKKKKLKRFNRFKAKIMATQESFQRGKRCIEVSSFVLALRAKLQGFFGKKKSMKSRFVHVDFFFTKNLIFLSPFVLL